MKSKNLIIVLLLVFVGITTTVSAQTSGGRQKEHRNQRGGGLKLRFKRTKSAGHADAFARGNKRGVFSRIFGGKKDGSAWVYKSAKPTSKERREQTRLFSRNRTNAKRYRDGILAQQSKRREHSRKSDFQKRKR